MAYEYEIRRDINGNPVYKLEKSPGRVTLISPSGGRIGYMEGGRSYNKNGHLIAQTESEGAIIAEAGLKWKTR